MGSEKVALTMKKYPSYRLHAGSGQARVTINGQTYYLGTHNTATIRKLYERLIAENGFQLVAQPPLVLAMTKRMPKMTYWVKLTSACFVACLLAR